MMDIRKFFFQYRSFTPIPVALMIIYFAGANSTHRVAGIFLLLLGEGIRIWAVSHAGGATRTRDVGAPSLCTSGPYAQTRNPLYVGNMLMYVGIVLIAGMPNELFAAIVTAVFFIVQYSLIISLEEETLDKLFREEYSVYKQNVPPIFPRLKPWRGGKNRKPATILQTLKTEKRTLQNVFLIILFIFIRINNPT
jgi:protein-S-isoprenylcysteine O-methyltransferase Ste14